MAKHNKFTVTTERLSDLYITQGLSVREIAKTCKCTVRTIKLYLGKYGITNHPRGGQVVLSIGEDVSRKLYHDEKRTIPEMAKILKCSETSIFKKLVEYGLQISAEEQAARKLERNKVRFAHQRMTGGYQYVKKDGHPLANINGYVTEHRLNAEAAMGRSLKDGERIHHINFQKRDNRPGNLAVLPSQAVHRQVHEYLERVAVYLTGLSKTRPASLDFGTAVFWGGQWITQIDLLPRTPADLDFLGHEELVESAVVTVN